MSVQAVFEIQSSHTHMLMSPLWNVGKGEIRHVKACKMNLKENEEICCVSPLINSDGGTTRS